MKKIIPFKKQIGFNNHVTEITSISLEHTLAPVKANLINGDFIVSGEYKMSENSTNTDSFEFFIPCEIELHECYNIDKVQISIDDFYYELIDSSILEVNIDVLLDKLEEEPTILNEIPIKHETLENFEKDLKERTVEEEDVEEEEQEELSEVEAEEKEEECEMQNTNMIEDDRCIEDEMDTTSIFSNFSSKEEYSTYKIYIVREQDTLESILEKYSTTKEELEKYNNLTELNIGDKIIVPYSYETNK